MSEKLTYHDVTVFVDGKEYVIFDHYGIELTCTRVGGWQLWEVRRGGLSNRLIGGEYEGQDFRVLVKGVVICGPITTDGTEPETASGI